MRIALRIEVSGLKGALEGLPPLRRLLDEYGVKASFLFSLGPDHGALPLSILLPESLRSRLPAPLVGRRAEAELKAVADSGHEIGLSGYTPMLWHRDLAFRDEHWTRQELEQACDSFQRIFGRSATVFGVAGWRLNAPLLALQQAFGFSLASDVRGRFAFLPELQGIRSGCPQLPTTLPTMDEMLLREGVDLENIHQYLFAESQRVLPSGEVFTLTADRDGIARMEQLERLIIMWRGGQWEFKTLSQLQEQLDPERLPHHRIGWGEIQGLKGYRAMQSLPVSEQQGEC